MKENALLILSLATNHSKVWCTDFSKQLCYRINDNGLIVRRVQAWAVKLGTELYHFGEFITRKKEVQDVSNTHIIILMSNVTIVELKLSLSFRASSQLK